MLLLTACTSLFGVEPEEGDYDVDMLDIDLSNACDDWGLELKRDSSTMMIEVEVDEDEIEFVDYWECERDGAEFDCEAEDEESVEGYDAVIVVVQTLSGEWISPTEFEAEYEATYSCHGDSCGDLDDCSVTATWEGELDD